jgi:TonB-linked SusC/RagA family outer membrane protein
MKKFRCRALFHARSSLIKCLLMTKLAILFILFFSTQSFAKSFGQRNISLNLEKVQLKKVFKAIEGQGFFRFVYKDDILPHDLLVSISVKDASLDDVLGRVLSGTSLSYHRMSDNLVVITPQPAAHADTGATALTVKGKVTNVKGEPFAGVSVQEKGTNNGTSTTDNGTFSLEITGVNATLIFTYIGYQPQEVAVGGQTQLTITLSAETSNLNEAIVIGYQTVRRKDLTGATGVANMADAGKITTGSVTESLQGLVPGVTIRNGGNPGLNPTVEIRGVGSFSSVSPLYVIDGMLSDDNTTVNPDDVASVQILKDASASAIYGSRAGNGVIIITTKKGKDGPAKFSISAKYGMQNLPKKWDVMNAPQFLKTEQTEYANSGVTLPAGVSAQIANPTINTNWQDATTRAGDDQDYNLSISGGSRTSSYLLSGSYYKNQGVLIGNDFQRASLRINMDTRRGRLTIGENMLLSNSSGNNPGGGINAFYESPTMLPIIAVQGSQYGTIPSNPAGWGFGSNDDPTYASNYVAVSALDKINYNYAKVIGNTYADFKFADWLSYRFNVGLEASFDYTREVRDTGIWRYNNQPPLTGITNDRETFTNFLMEHTLNFNKSFGDHSISAVVGFSRTQQEREYTTAGRTLLQTAGGQPLTTIGSALGTASADGGTSVLWRQHGYLGRINYTYADKYLLTLTGRIDQDTRFGPDRRTGYFPSAAVGWRISKEKFFSISWIDDLKIRGSYGRLGISSGLDATGSSFPYLALLNNSPRAVYGTGQTPVVGQYQASLSNPDIHWETRTEGNVGFDATLFHNRVSVTADVYNALSTDVLVALPQPLYLGVVQATGQQTVTNAASIRNKGVELMVTYHSGDRAFKWDVSANLTTIDNKVVSVGNMGIDANGNKVNYLQPTDFIRAQVGHSIGQWYVIKTAGIFQSQAEINAYTNKGGQMIQPNAKPGDIKYVDANGDGSINDNDRQFAGSPWPTLQGGAQFNASYKHFTFNLQLIGVFGDKIYDDVRRVLDSYQLTNFRKDVNPWSAGNSHGNDPRLAIDQPSDPTVSVNNMAQTSRWLENGSYVRVRNLEIGYILPGKALAAAGISTARVYIAGQNLVTLTGYKGLDPDVVGNGILQRGFDAGNWPPSRVLSAGLQFSF